MADTWGLPVRRRSVVDEANSLGAAVVGGRAVGLIDDWSAAPRPLTGGSRLRAGPGTPRAGPRGPRALRGRVPATQGLVPLRSILPARPVERPTGRPAGPLALDGASERRSTVRRSVPVLVMAALILGTSGVVAQDGGRLAAVQAARTAHLRRQRRPAGHERPQRGDRPVRGHGRRLLPGPGRGGPGRSRRRRVPTPHRGPARPPPSRAARWTSSSATPRTPSAATRRGATSGPRPSTTARA